MKSEKMLDAFENISNEIIEEAYPKMVRVRKTIWIKWSAVAACFVLVVASVFYSGIFDPNSISTDPAAVTGNVTSSQPSSTDIITQGDEPATNQLRYDKSDYYLIALTLNDVEPTIDFNALFDELLVNPMGIENPTWDDYFETNKDAYDKLISYGDDTLLYCSCYMLQNWQEYRDNTGEITKARLAFELTLKMTAGEPYDNPYHEVTEDVSLNDRYIHLIKYSVARWRNQGTEWFIKNAPGLFQIIRAMTSVPDYRFLITDFQGVSYYDYVTVNATQAFMWVFEPSEIAQKYFTNIPDAPKGVCNENTSWILSQDKDGTVTLTFKNTSDGTYIGKMVYYPKPEELEGQTTGIYGSVKVVME